MTSLASSLNHLSQPTIRQDSNNAITASGGSVVKSSGEPPTPTSRDNIQEIKQLPTSTNDVISASGGSPIGESSGNAPTSTTSRDNVRELDRRPSQKFDLDPKTRSRTGYVISILGVISAAIFFGLQYQQSNALAIKANNLAIEESCRSHPNNTYLQNLATCREALQRNDFDIQKRSLQPRDQLLDTGALEQRNDSVQLLTAFERLLFQSKLRYHRILTQFILIVTSFLIQENTQSCFLYLWFSLLFWRLLLRFRMLVYKVTWNGNLKHNEPPSRLNASLAMFPSISSPVHIRRESWLAAIQVVGALRHNFFLEAAALCLKIVKLTMRNVIGVSGYTGTTEEQEAARVKAWSIAIDAQLAGGDSEVSKSRLTLTLLASGTLPYTPTRVMLNALHIRVLLWEVGNAGFNGFYMFHEVAAKLARWKWNEAKQLHRMMAHTKVKQEEELPEYLAALLEQEYDDVLVDSIGQRAYNLAWNLPTSYNTDGSSDGMDNIVDDFAIRSPLDAVAAWYSSLVLQRALSRSLDTKEDDVAAQRSIVEDVTLAIKIAPIGSAAQIRALTGRTVLVKEKRGASIAESLQALGPLERPDKKRDATSSYIHASTSMIGLSDIKMSLRCVMAIVHLERFPSPASPEAAPRIIGTISPVNLTLLGFTAAFKLMEKINGHDIIAVSCTGSLEKLASYLRIWISYKGGKSGLAQEVKKDLVKRCLDISKCILGREDAGYESTSEDTVNKKNYY